MSDLKRVVELAKLLQTQKSAVQTLKDDLAEAQETYLRLEREDLPALMAEVGLEEVKLEDGTRIVIQEDCAAGLSEATRERGLAWLIEHDFGGLVKTNVSVEFGRGDRKEAQALAARLSETIDGVQVIENVHPSTLRAFVKEQLRDAKPIPMDLFNVFPYSKAVIK